MYILIHYFHIDNTLSIKNFYLSELTLHIIYIYIFEIHYPQTSAYTSLDHYKVNRPARPPKADQRFEGHPAGYGIELY